MAVHSFSLSAGEETALQRFITLTGETEEEVINTYAKALFIEAMIRRVNNMAIEKLASASIVSKIDFLET